MIRLLGCAFLATAAMAQQFHIDHVTVAGKNVEAMQKALREAGIPSEYGGPHSNHATEMALTSFPDGSYLELIAAQKPTGAAEHYWGKFIDANAGPCAWAVSVPDVAAAVLGSHPARSGRASAT